MRMQLRHYLLGLATIAGSQLTSTAADRPTNLPDPPPSMLEEHAKPLDLTPAAKELEAHGGGHGEKGGHSEKGRGEKGEHSTDCLPKAPSISEHGGHGEGERVEGGVITSFEYLMMRPRRRGQDFAIIDNNMDTTAAGPIKNLDNKMKSGFRIGVGYRMENSGLELMFTYTYLQSTNQQTVLAPVGGNLYATLTRPGLIDYVSSARANNSFRYNAFDLDIGKSWHVDSALTLRVLAGVRLTSIVQDLGVTYDGMDANRASYRQKLNLDGAGPTLGGEATFNLGSGFNLFGRGRGGLIYGNLRSDTQEANNGGQTVNTNVQDKYTQIIPMAQVGVGMGFHFRNVTLSAGYEVTNYFNLIDSPRFVDDFSEGKFVHRTSDLSIGGLFLQLGLAY